MQVGVVIRYQVEEKARALEQKCECNSSSPGVAKKRECTGGGGGHQQEREKAAPSFSLVMLEGPPPLLSSYHPSIHHQRSRRTPPTEMSIHRGSPSSHCPCRRPPSDEPACCLPLVRSSSRRVRELGVA